MIAYDWLPTPSKFVRLTLEWDHRHHDFFPLLLQKFYPWYPWVQYLVSDGLKHKSWRVCFQQIRFGVISQFAKEMSDLGFWKCERVIVRSHAFILQSLSCLVDARACRLPSKETRPWALSTVWLRWTHLEIFHASLRESYPRVAYVTSF